jgi:hypothetical protein
MHVEGEGGVVTHKRVGLDVLSNDPHLVLQFTALSRRGLEQDKLAVH